MFACIPLSNGGHTIVDESDLPLIAGRVWRKQYGRNGIVQSAVSGTAGKANMVILHRVLMQAKLEQVVDHKNGDPLNNRRANLRTCTHAENTRNSRRRKSNKSGYKGVYFDKRRRKWRAQIKVDGRKWNLGSYESPQDAYSVYCLMARELHGEFARFD